MKKYRYPGVKPFTLDDKDIFFGRNDDIDKLVKLINLKRITVLYSKSGYGKSSLLQAGVNPVLEENSQIITIRFQNYIDAEQSNSPLQTVKAALFLIQKSFLNKIIKKEKTLWYYLKNRQLDNFERNIPKKIVLVFDQFEELFSYPDKNIDEFLEEFSEIVSPTIPQKYMDEFEEKIFENPNFLTKEELNFFHNNVDLRIVISIRSDKLSYVNRLKTYIPNILQNTYELLPFTEAQAEEAILNPIYTKGDFISPRFDYENEALEKILKFLTKSGKQKIETFQIQILCQYCENLIIENQDIVTTNKGIPYITSERLGNISKIYENFYSDLLKKFPKSKLLAIQTLIEDNLIVNIERVSLPDKTILTFPGIDENILQILIDSHIIRGEENSVGGVSYELAHDTLIAPILKERAKRLEKEAHLELLREAKEERIKASQKMIFTIGIILMFVSFISIGLIWELKSRQLEKNAKKLTALFQPQINDLKLKNAELIKIQKYLILNTEKDDYIYDILMSNAKHLLENEKLVEATVYLETCKNLDVTKEDIEKANSMIDEINQQLENQKK